MSARPDNSVYLAVSTFKACSWSRFISLYLSSLKLELIVRGNAVSQCLTCTAAQHISETWRQAPAVESWVAWAVLAMGLWASPWDIEADACWGTGADGGECFESFFCLSESILQFDICGLLLIYRNMKYLKYCACETGVLILLFCFCCLLLIISVAVQTRWEDYPRELWLCFVFLHCQAGQQAVCSTESFPLMCTWKYCKSNVKNRII